MTGMTGVPTQGIKIVLHPVSDLAKAKGSPVAYWQVPDIEAKLAEVTAAGATTAS
jgi:hypothetical protein